MKDKKILVSGATGFVGSNLTQRLLQEGAHVRILVRNSKKARPLEQLGAEVFEMDLADPVEVDQAVKDCEWVFHTAAVLNTYCSKKYYRLVNVEGTRALALAAMRGGVKRFIHVSTNWVYGMQAGDGIDETSPIQPSKHSYADTKLETEWILKDLMDKGLPAVIVQPTLIYGPLDPAWTMRSIELIRSGKMIMIGGGLQRIQPIYIDDLVEGILLAAERGKIGNSYILCGPKIVTLKEFIGFLLQMHGKHKAPSLPTPVALLISKVFEGLSSVGLSKTPLLTSHEVRAALANVVCSGGKAEGDLGFKSSTSLEEGMKKVENWLNNTKQDSLNP